MFGLMRPVAQNSSHRSNGMVSSSTADTQAEGQKRWQLDGMAVPTAIDGGICLHAKEYSRLLVSLGVKVGMQTRESNVYR